MSPVHRVQHRNQRMLFPIIALSVLALMYGYVGWRTIAPARLGTRPEITLIELTSRKDSAKT